MTAQKAFDYVGRMVDSGAITAEEADRILSIEIGIDISQFVTAPEEEIKKPAKVVYGVPSTPFVEYAHK